MNHSSYCIYLTRLFTTFSSFGSPSQLQEAIGSVLHLMLQTVLIFFLIICFQDNFCPQIKSVKKWVYVSHTSDMGPTQVTGDSYQFLINIICRGVYFQLTSFVWRNMFMFCWLYNPNFCVKIAMPG